MERALDVVACCSPLDAAPLSLEEAGAAATMFKALGLDPHKELPGPQNRPLPLADFNVKPIGELF